MDRSGLYQYLGYLGTTVPSSQGRYGWVVAHCPLARWRHAKGVDNSPSFGVKEEPGGESHYYCFSCGAHGGLEDLIWELRYRRHELPEYVQLGKAMELAADELEGVVIDLDAPEQPTTKVMPFPEEWLDSFMPAVQNHKAWSYLRERGLALAQMQRYDLRFDTDREAVCFPIRAFDGTLVGLHGRHIEPGDRPKYHAYKWKDYWNRLPWLGEYGLDPNEPVVLVESVFDYAAVEPVYGNVIAALSAGLSKEKLARVSACFDVTTFFDWGTGGDNARAQIDKFLTGSVITHVVPPEEYGDPGDMPRELVAAVLEEHVMTTMST